MFQVHMRIYFVRRRRPRRLMRLGVLLVLAVAGFAATEAAPGQDQQKPPQFRAGVAAVPVEVQVVDSNGDPVTGLTAADFTIRESGVVQEIALFRPVSAAGPGATEGRTFLIVLGRGRLNQPTRALDALIDFVRGLQPYDRVGVTAYLRLIEPTTNHEPVARFLTAYRDRHENIDGRIRRALPEGRHVTRDGLAALDALFTPFDTHLRDLPGAEANVYRHYTTTYVRNGLQYLGTLPGSKHAIVVAEHPLGGLGALEREHPLKNIWLRLAASARTSLSFIHAGGQNGRLAAQSLDRGRLVTQSVDRFGVVKSSAVLTDLTGGISAFFKFAAEPLASIDRMTRHHYLLGYYPLKQVADHEFRLIDVSVNRPGLRVLYRHGYVSQPPVISDTDFREAITEDRLQTTAARLVAPPSPQSFDGGIVMVTMRLAATARASDDGVRLDVSVSFDPTRVTFVKDGDEYLTDLDLLLLAIDAQRATISQRRLKLNVRLSAAEHARIRREWLRYDTTLDLPATPAFLNAVLFDYEADYTATAQLQLRR